MRIAGLVALTLAGLTAGAGPLLSAQFGAWDQLFIPQNDPPPTELVVARWRFGTNGMIGHMGWSHNYPAAEINLNQFIEGATHVNVERMSYRIVDLGSEEVFRYPFALISEPGEMDLTPQEVDNFRSYVERGGFVVVDDFDGAWQFENFQRQISHAFPGKSLTPLTVQNPVFRTFFAIESLDIFEPYVPGGRPVFYGLFNDDGTLAMVACFNNDLMNFWDWIGSPRYPLPPATEAFRMGANFVIYAMTH